MRAVVYARYSSENQREASIEDQVEICRRYIKGQRWTFVRAYTDRAVSGASDQRPSYQQMLADAEADRFDVIVCEALDRLSRRLSDVASLHDQLEFRGIRLHAVNLGAITTMHVGLLGTMAQLFLTDLKHKTRRGQLGRALAGRIPGGIAYGYDLIEGRSGERTVNDAETAIVRRIFREFNSGRSPRAIAKGLNAEGIGGPSGRAWRDTTIRGQVDRGTGILNNAIYVGRLEWNRCSYVKDPRTGRRTARPNPRKLWEVVDVPALRILPDEIWHAAKLRQEELAHGAQKKGACNPLNGAHRPKFLLSGLLKCGSCGGGYTIVAHDRYGCATRRSKGTCNNAATVSRQEIETRVLDGLREKLLTPPMVREFTQALQLELNRAAADLERKAAAIPRQLNQLERKIAGIVSAIEDGNYSKLLGERLADLEREQALLKAQLPDMPTSIVRLHPGIADIYAEKVATLEQSLNDPAICGEAGQILRSLISRIELRPRQDANGVDAVLHGDLAQILAFAESTGKKKELPGGIAAGSSLSVVAGIGFEPMTFRL